MAKAAISGDSNQPVQGNNTPAATGMPTTVIFGKDGVERARLAGGADWSGAEAKAVIDKVLAES